MRLHLHSDSEHIGLAAARQAAHVLQTALQERDRVSLILATGTSQLATLKALVQLPDIDWSRVCAFHLDEYLGLDANHPASFCGYLQQQFMAHVPALGQLHFINGMAPDPQAECNRLSALLPTNPIELALIGIGENGHLAFNDPPADFETSAAFHVVSLDEACRSQQVGEGWFDSLELVPREAISMTVPQILKSKHLIVSVPDARKAQAVHDAVHGSVQPDCPASALQKHPACDLYLDRASSALL